MWIYIESDRGIFTTGFYKGEVFKGDADFPTREAAAERVSFLNGGPGGNHGQIQNHLDGVCENLEHITAQLEKIVEKLDRIPTNMKLGRE